MGVDAIASGSIDIAISGLRAQRVRMDVIANNIANANTSRTPSGKPYRRRDVVLSTGTGGGTLTGVQILKVAEDPASPLKRIKAPGDPAADEDGYVGVSNVELPKEMIELVVASRAYQANAAVLKRFQDSINTTLELLR